MPTRSMTVHGNLVVIATVPGSARTRGVRSMMKLWCPYGITQREPTRAPRDATSRVSELMVRSSSSRRRSTSPTARNAAAAARPMSVARLLNGARSTSRARMAP